MPPIADIHREVYVPYVKERGAAVVGARYVGTGLRREETLCYECASDWSEGHRVRASEDNGKTWSQWELMHEEWPMQAGLSKEEWPVAWCHDPVSGNDLRFVFHRILVGPGAEAIREGFDTGRQTWFDHNFWQMSDDRQRTWGQAHLLRYEDGPDFDPDDWGNEAFRRSNQMYGSYGAIATREGTIVYPSAEVPMEISDRGETETVHGVLCFVGRWSPAEQTYRWEISQPIHVPHRVSGRGLQEPTIEELRDGRLLLVMRGSSVVFPSNWEGEVESPGRSWMSTSADGGRSWSDVTDLRYDTGEQFYSPATFDKLLRHSRTGKLYWFGNVTPSPPAGNLPRYPLYLAEVDESIPALKKDTVTVIDDRDPQKDSDQVQFSNFNVFENRETGDIEMYMTRYGERAVDWRAADAYKYTISLSGGEST